MARLLPFEVGERRVHKAKHLSMRPLDRGGIRHNTREDGRGRVVQAGNRGSSAKGCLTKRGIHAWSQEGAQVQQWRRYGFTLTWSLCILLAGGAAVLAA